MWLSGQGKGAIMSIQVQANLSPASIFQSQFGTPPGTQDAKAECEKWERLCGELLAERERLREALEKARLEKIMHEWDATPIPPTWEEACALADRSTSIEQIVAEMR